MPARKLPHAAARLLLSRHFNGKHCRGRRQRRFSPPSAAYAQAPSFSPPPTSCLSSWVMAACSPWLRPLWVISVYWPSFTSTAAPPALTTPCRLLPTRYVYHLLRTSRRYRGYQPYPQGMSPSPARIQCMALPTRVIPGLRQSMQVVPPLPLPPARGYLAHKDICSGSEGYVFFVSESCLLRNFIAADQTTEGPALFQPQLKLVYTNTLCAVFTHI